MIDPKNTPPNKPHISSKVTLFTDRCIMCSRCVRFTREVSGQAELTVINRGDHSEIDIFPGQPLENKLSGNVVDLCPVGALGSKDFLYKQRVWFLKTTPSVCPNCSTGCSVDVDANKDVVYRLRARVNPLAQGYFICDEGRYGFHYTHSTERLRRPQSRQGAALAPSPWSDLLPAVKAKFADAAARDAAGVVGVLSPFLTVEEAFLLAKYLKGLSKQAKLALGFVPVVGQDDTYPKDRRGNPVQPVKFTIRAEKCPNRRGVEEVLKHFEGSVVPFAKAVDAATRGETKALLLTGGYPDRGTLDALTEPPADLMLAVTEIFQGPATSHAKYVLPASAFSEKEGTWLN